TALRLITPERGGPPWVKVPHLDNCNYRLQIRPMRCAHQWIPRLATMPEGHTLLSAFNCGKCGLIVGVCPASKEPNQHPFGFPHYRGHAADCEWCSPGKPGNIQ